MSVNFKILWLFNFAILNLLADCNQSWSKSKMMLNEMSEWIFINLHVEFFYNETTYEEFVPYILPVL